MNYKELKRITELDAWIANLHKLIKILERCNQVNPGELVLTVNKKPADNNTLNLNEEFTVAISAKNTGYYSYEEILKNIIEVARKELAEKKKEFAGIDVSNIP